ncbi:hypothetical protein DNTS_029414, partial [Danionella cerebrum]
MLFLASIAFLVALSWTFPTDIVVRFERSVFLNGSVVERILVSDEHLKQQLEGSPVVRPIQDETLKRMVEYDQTTASHGSFIRLRECKLRGCEVVELSDRFQRNGRDYLILDSETGSWTKLIPEEHDLQHPAMIEAEPSIHLREECEDFIKQMNDYQNQEEFGLLRVMTPVLSSVLFIGFVLISLIFFKRHGEQTTAIMFHVCHVILLKNHCKPIKPLLMVSSQE